MVDALQSMDIDLLKTFLEVNRTRHFGHAAENLYLSQSAISARIRQLEEMVGAPVFTRDRNDIRLTPKGKKLLSHAESIVIAWNRARQEVTLGADIEQSLTIGGTPSLWDITLREWVYRIYSEMPEIALTTEADGSEVLLRRLLDGTLDIALTFEGPKISKLQVKQLPGVDLVLVSTVKGEKIKEALAGNYCLVDWGTSFLTTHAQHFRDYPVPRMQFALGRMAYEFLMRAGGSAYLARTMIEEDLNKGRLHLVKEAPVIQRPVYAVYPEPSDKQELLTQVLGRLP